MAAQLSVSAQPAFLGPAAEKRKQCPAGRKAGWEPQRGRDGGWAIDSSSSRLSELEHPG